MNANTNMNTIDRLRRMHPALGRVSEEIVQEDLARGRAAVAHAHRKQAWVAGGVGGFALAAIVASAAILPALQTGTLLQAGPVDTPQVHANPALQLVSYTGTQPDGYHLGKVPAGFSVESSDKDALILAPAGATDGSAEFVDRIVVSQQGSFTYDRDKRQVTINGEPALIALSADPDPATEVQFTTGGHAVNIQIGATIKLTDQQIADFAQSITVTGDPTTSAG
jgi:hypothetical protein